ncbi:MAG TPA: hypothetical protein VH599_01910 [Ktedonobacterales bacterium]|jgi:ribosome-binding protein aMBF1 (putative translation factor)
MAELADLPEDSWQRVVCRICGHRFAVAVEESKGASVFLCQACSILVEWFGQEEAQPTPAPPKPIKANKPQKRAAKAEKQERQRDQLASLLERWGDLWRNSEEQE